MKKNIFCIANIILPALGIVSCKKSVPSNVLPPSTQEGKNTVGFKVNGKVWTPYSKCSFSQNPCGAIDLEYNLPNTPKYSFGFNLSRTSDPNSSFRVGTFTSSTISTIGNKYDSVDVIYTDYSNGNIIDYTKSYNPKGNFTITKIDFNNQIISGTFECTLYSATDSVVITEGRFDCKFYTCICNN